MLVDRYLDSDKKAEQAMHAAQDKPIRSLAKAVSWRVTGTIDTIILSWLFTGNIGTALSIGFTEVATKMLLYYVHERVWNRISGTCHAKPATTSSTSVSNQYRINNRRVAGLLDS